MSKKLSDLHPEFQPIAELFLELCGSDLGFQMVVVDTLRTAAEHEQNLKVGTSKAKRSKHQPQPCCQKSHALDAAPKHLMLLKNWASEHPDWLKIGELAESLGLEWGGRWSGKWKIPGTKDYKIVDCPHFQWKEK